MEVKKAARPHRPPTQNAAESSTERLCGRKEGRNTAVEFAVSQDVDSGAHRPLATNSSWYAERMDS